MANEMTLETLEEQQLDIEVDDAPIREEGDVTDGSVDYYDFDWGEAVEVDEATIFAGCAGNSRTYGGCTNACEWQPEPEPEPEPTPCEPNEPDQDDDPGYATVDP